MGILVNRKKSGQVILNLLHLRELVSDVIWKPGSLNGDEVERSLAAMPSHDVLSKDLRPLVGLSQRCLTQETLPSIQVSVQSVQSADRSYCSSQEVLPSIGKEKLAPLAQHEPKIDPSSTGAQDQVPSTD